MTKSENDGQVEESCEESALCKLQERQIIMATSGYKAGMKEAKTGKSGTKAHEKKESPKFKAGEKKGEMAFKKAAKKKGAK